MPGEGRGPLLRGPGRCSRCAAAAVQRWRLLGGDARRYGRLLRDPPHRSGASPVQTLLRPRQRRSEGLRKRGFDEPQIAVITGMVKDSGKKFSDRDYAKVRALGNEYHETVSTTHRGLSCMAPTERPSISRSETCVAAGRSLPETSGADSGTPRSRTCSTPSLPYAHVARLELGVHSRGYRPRFMVSFRWGFPSDANARKSRKAGAPPQEPERYDRAPISPLARDLR